MRSSGLLLGLSLLLSSAWAAAMQPLDDIELDAVNGAGVGFFLDGFLYDQDSAMARIEGFKDSSGNPVTIQLEDSYIKGQGSQRGTLDPLANIGTPLHPFRLGVRNASEIPTLPAGTEVLQLVTPTWTDPLNDTHHYGLWAYYQGCLYGEAGCTNPDLAVGRLNSNLSALTSRQTALLQRYASVGFLTLKQGIDTDMAQLQTRQQAVDAATAQVQQARSVMEARYAAAPNNNKPPLGQKYDCFIICTNSNIRAYNDAVDDWTAKNEALMNAQIALSQVWQTQRHGYSLSQRSQDYTEFASLCGEPTSQQPTCSGGRIAKMEGDRASLVLVSTSLKDGKTRVPGIDLGFGAEFSVPSTAWSGSASNATRGATTTRADFFSLNIEGFTLHGSYVNLWGNAAGMLGELSMQLYADKLILGACRTCTDANRFIAKNVYLDLNLGHGTLQPLSFSMLSDGELRFRLPGVTWANYQQFYAQVPKSNVSIGNLSLSNVNLGAQAIRGLRVDYLDMRTVNLPR